MQHGLIHAIVVFIAGLGLFAQAGAETHAYIPNRQGNSVLRIATREETTATVALPGEPYGVAVTPDGSRIFITGKADDNVTAIPAASFATPGSQVHVPVGSMPDGVAVTPNGRFAFVANFDDDTVSLITVASLSVTDTIALADGSGPRGVAAFFDEAENAYRVYVTNFLAGTVSVITPGEIKTIEDVGNGPVGAALTSDGRWLYVALQEDDRVAVIRTSDNTIAEVIRVGDSPFGVAVGSADRVVYVTNFLDRSVSVIRVSDNRVERTYAVDKLPTGVAAPINADFAYVVANLTEDENDDTNTYDVLRIDHDGQTVETVLADQPGVATALGNFIGGPPPDAPGDLNATESDDRIDLTWSDNSDDELGFIIERRKESDDTFDEVDRVDGNDTSFDDHGLESDTTYVYRVRAFNETGFSSYSGTAEATTGESDFSWCFIGTLQYR